MKRFGLTVERSINASIRFFIRLLDDCCTVSVDSSGELLYKRGYRRITGRAPLRETTAAALLMAAAWERYRVIADPCCGTGSIILEALQLACNRAPGINREFAFSSWPSFNGRKWDRIKKSAAACIVKPHAVRCIAGDIDGPVLKSLRKNSAALSSDGLLTIEQADCLNFNDRCQYGRHGLIISNLPFGKRIEAGGGTIDQLYRELGRRLKKFCSGWDFAFLVADPQFERKAGLVCRTVLTFNNGGIRVRLVKGKLR